MQITIDLSDALLERARDEATSRGTTLNALIEESLSETIAQARSRAGYQLETHTFGGNGLQPGLSWGDFAALRDLAQGRDAGSGAP